MSMAENIVIFAVYAAVGGSALKRLVVVARTLERDRRQGHLIFRF
jgi:hypothetical protein